MASERLLAKSLPKYHPEGQPPPESATLLGHLKDVHRAAMAILRHTGQAQLRAVGLESQDWLPRLERVVLLAAAVHDLGKANDHFQSMIHDPFGDHRQALRHEWATLLIVDDADWAAWLRPAVASDDEWEVFRWCVSGHHPKYGRGAPPEVAEGRPAMRLPLDHSDVGDAVAWIGRTFGLSGEPPRAARRESLTFEPGNAIDLLHDRHYKSEEVFDRQSPDSRRFAAVAKNCLIAADIAGSALPRFDVADRDGWIADVLGMTLPSAAAYRAITARGLKNCPPEEVDDKLRPFQKAAAASPTGVTFVRAGCGTGKTLAAYRWAEAKCTGRRLYVCYPTTNTGTAGFQDYLLDPALAEHVATDLIHGRRKVDLDLLKAGEGRNESVARIESLETWRVPVVACTVDTVLGLIQNNKRGLFGWPALAQAGFVFDEIHAYDDKLFDALLHFLAVMRGVPVLLMTASLQEGRRGAIEGVLAARGETLTEIPGPEDLERRERYRPPAKIEKKIDAVLPRVREAVAAGERVLVVVNTVGRALRLAETLADLDPLAYHSRFKYRDRVRRHQAVVEVFKFDGAGGALAVCTQVAEMSLDLSATVLVTELAPVPALIQRLGRLNRRAAEGDPPRPFLIAEPTGSDGKPSPLPYEEDDLETARRWLAELGDGPLSQRDLSDAWRRFDPQTPPPRWQSAWLDYGPANPVLELRDGSPNVTVVMEEDLPDLRTRRGEAKPRADLIEVALPMPIRRTDDWQRRDDFGRPVDFKGVPVAKAGSLLYDELRGAEWAEQ